LFERTQYTEIGQEGECMTAANTVNIFEEHQRTAMIAMKHFHKITSITAQNVGDS
jgi:hypothetical protein